MNIEKFVMVLCLDFGIIISRRKQLNTNGYALHLLCKHWVVLIQ